MNNWHWEQYYQEWRGRSANKNLLKALAFFDAEKKNLKAIDLGAGTGRDTFELLRRGWYVHALDSEKQAIDIINEDVPTECKTRLTTQIGSFGNVTFPESDLINASLSLFFSNNDDFETAWANVLGSIIY